MSRVAAPLIAAEIGAITRGCSAGIDVQAVIGWAESVRFDTVLLARVLKGDVSLRGFGIARPWKPLWPLAMFKGETYWYSLTRAEVRKLRSVGADVGDLKWASYAKGSELEVKRLVAGKCRLVGLTEEGWQFAWIWPAPGPIQLQLFEDIGGTHLDGRVRALSADSRIH